jgi:hypothetical protein
MRLSNEKKNRKNSQYLRKRGAGAASPSKRAGRPRE